MRSRGWKVLIPVGCLAAAFTVIAPDAFDLAPGDPERAGAATSAEPVGGRRAPVAEGGNTTDGPFQVDISRAPAGHGYGYTISTDEGVLIRQPHLPAVSGKAAFTRAEDARRVAELVVRKMKAGVYPPSVTPEDLDTMGIRDPAVRRDATRRRRE